jgi:hypothetical protein
VKLQQVNLRELFWITTGAALCLGWLVNRTQPAILAWCGFLIAIFLAWAIMRLSEAPAEID